MLALLAAAPEPAIATALVATGLLLGWLFATWLRKQDHHTFVLARAPRLPVRALAVHDDAWIRGEVRSEAPLQCPWFDVACVAYSYSIEVKVTRTITVTGSDGKVRTETRTEWETEHHESEARDFDLDDGASVRVRLTKGDNEAMESTDHDYEHGSRRHSASYLPLGATVSVLGVLLEDRTFGPLREVPLLVTRRLPNERVRTSAKSEGWLFFAALFFAFAGGFGGAAVALAASRAEDWLTAIAIGLLPLFVQWWLLTHNRLLRLRQQVRTAQRQIDVDLAVRFDLVPNLVAVVRAASSHERELLERTASLRSRGSTDANVRAEPEALATVRQVLLLHERYPALRSDTLYADLHRRLWAVEEKIAHSRSFYDDVVTEWNDRIAHFPSLLVARANGHRPAELFAASCDEALPPPLEVDA